METRRQNRQGAGPPVFTYVAAPGSPLVSVGRLGRGFTLGEAAGPHSHDFLTLVYFERGDGVLRSGSRRWEVVAGDLFLISPGEVHDASGLGEAEGWLVFFSGGGHRGRICERLSGLARSSPIVPFRAGIGHAGSTAPERASRKPFVVGRPTFGTRS